ncbi:MAG: ABC transporter permease [Anaerolineales bacterium]|nr:ABC transporter permease [Anaerolineales bacterium]MCA9927171.1 ABC transporter permease [Anaerolineales bacterium]
MVTNPQQSRWQRFLRHLQNPVTVKELRSRMRGRRAFVVLTVYLFVMGGFISLVYLAFASSSGGPYGPDAREVGRVIFSTVVGIQTFLVLFIGPSFTAGAISGEKERQTYDLLRTTLLSAPAFVTGKLLSALSYVLLLIFTAVPIQSIAFLLGGVSFLELLLSQIVLVVAAVAVAIFGLFCSTVMKSTLGASVTTFAGILVVTAGIPALVGLFAAILGPMISLSSSSLIELLMTYLLLVLAATNLPATLIVSDVFLLEEGAYLYHTSAIGGRTAYLFSPWPLFLIFYGLLALLFYWLTVRRIRRIADK